MTKVVDAIAADKTEADAALERADATELHALFLRAQLRLTKLDEVLSGLVEHYAGTKEMPRFAPPDDHAVDAMERVALEALSLARHVVDNAVIGLMAKTDKSRS